jgi:hypothetical protein
MATMADGTYRTIGRRIVGASAGGFVALVLAAGGAAAQDGGDYVGNPPPTVDVPGAVDPDSGNRPDPAGAVDPDRKARSGSDGVLAFTGSDVVGLVAVGAAAVATGTALRWRARRVRRSSLSATAA